MDRLSLFDRWRARLGNRFLQLQATTGPCLVVGSAPHGLLPAGLCDEWTLISVNAAQAGAKRWGLHRTPDLTVMSGQMLRRKPENVAAQEALRGERTGTLLLIERRMTARKAIPVLSRLPFHYERLRTWSHWQRAGLALRLLGDDLATGRGESKISTGVFSVLFAVASGHAPVVMSGFSLSQAGHSYNELGHRRQHTESDLNALRLLRKKQIAVFSADPAFAAESGLPLWDLAALSATRAVPPCPVPTYQTSFGP